MKIQNNYSGITKDLGVYHEFIIKKGCISINVEHFKNSFRENKKYFLALIRFERSNWRITCKDTEENYKKWLDLFVDLIDWHSISFQDKKKLISTFWWITKIHNIRKESEFNEWNKSWWEYWIFKEKEFGKRRFLIVLPAVASLILSVFFWIFDFDDISKKLEEVLQSNPSTSKDATTLSHDKLDKKKE